MSVHTTLRSLLSVFLIALFASATALATSSNKDDEVDKFLQTVRRLEQEPLAKNAKDLRGEALRWVIETDKVTVQACSLLIQGLEEKYKYSSELVTQYTIGMAAHKLSHPDADENAVQQGGVDSALVSYEAMVKTQPKARNEFMESLIAKRADGSLAAYTIENNCKAKK